MTEKQKDYIKALLEQEREFGFFRWGKDAVIKLGGSNWESNYKNIPHAIAHEVIEMLHESISQNEWAWTSSSDMCEV